MDLEEARRIVKALPLEQRVAMATIAQRALVKAYTLGFEHGESGTGGVSPEVLFAMLDSPKL